MMVTQANKLSTAAYSMTLREKRLVMLVASVIRKDDEHMKRYSFPAADVMNFLGLENNNNGYNELRSVTGELLSRVVDISTPETKRGYRQFQWMASASYIPKEDSGTGQAMLELQAHSEMRPFLLELKEHFSSIPFAEIARLPSFHSVRIFEILWAKSHQLMRGTVKISLEELKKMLKLEKQYPNFADFRKRVLDKAQQDLDEKTPLSFTYEVEKQGVKVVGLVFTVKANQKAVELGLTLPDRLNVSELPPVAEKKREDKARNNILLRLVALGVREAQAETLANSYDLDYIAENLDVVEEKQRRGGIKHVVSYVYKSLAQDYRDQEPEIARAARERREAQKEAERAQLSLEEQYEAERKRVVEQTKRDIGTAAILDDFRPHIELLGANNSLINNAIKKHGATVDTTEADPLLRSFLHQFILDTYAPPQFRTFETWQEAQNEAS
ncbi:MAG: replication initiation protein [Trueperaceae bacterium]|nr:replication initiation protein [Trueperaceae bacterium]